MIEGLCAIVQLSFITDKNVKMEEITYKQQKLVTEF